MTHEECIHKLHRLEALICEVHRAKNPHLIDYDTYYLLEYEPNHPPYEMGDWHFINDTIQLCLRNRSIVNRELMRDFNWLWRRLNKEY